MGLAWAAKTQILRHYGLYDAMIIGSGDRLLVGTIYGYFRKIMDVFEMNKARRRHYIKWAVPFHKTVGRRISHVPGPIYHLWHGEFASRKTLERHRVLASLDFDPESDLVIGDNGAWQWRRSRPELENFFTNYFRGRSEDG